VVIGDLDVAPSPVCVRREADNPGQVNGQRPLPGAIAGKLVQAVACELWQIPQSVGDREKVKHPYRPSAIEAFETPRIAGFVNAPCFGVFVVLDHPVEFFALD
jgi:hypothetical protein